MNRMPFEPIRIYFSNLRSSAGVRQAIARVFEDWATGVIQAKGEGCERIVDSLWTHSTKKNVRIGWFSQLFTSAWYLQANRCKPTDYNRLRRCCSQSHFFAFWWKFYEVIVVSPLVQIMEEQVRDLISQIVNRSVIWSLWEANGGNF